MWIRYASYHAAGLEVDVTVQPREACALIKCDEMSKLGETLASRHLGRIVPMRNASCYATHALYIVRLPNVWPFRSTT